MSETMTPEAAERQKALAAANLRLAASFADVVTLLMRSPQYKHTTLADLEWLVLPGLATGQFALAHAREKRSGLPVPVAVALWASVSEDVDRRLEQMVAQPLRLKPDEWRSDRLVAAEGAPQAVVGLLKGVQQRTLAGRPIKARVLASDGTAKVGILPAVEVQPSGAKTP